ncbi:MAG TPA: zf-HC2 domain-containing protein [Jiangellaceae bacterium]
MNPLTCQAAVRAASDQLAGLLSDAERGALEDHLADCESCSCLMEQLRSTVAVLGSRPEVAYGAVVDAALAELDPLDAGLITLIDIDGAPFSQAVLELDLPSGEARDRLARARFAVRAALDRYLQS